MKKIVLIIGIAALIYALITAILIGFGIGLFIFTVLTIIVITYGLLFDKVHKLIHILMGAGFATFFGMITFLAIYGNIHTADFTEDVVFVLGAGLVADEIPPTLEARLNQALLYFEQNSRAMFIVCGGYGEGQTISEARAMADFLIAGGIPYEQIILEDLSTNTYENFAFAIDILAEYFPDGFRSVVVTNDFHMYRSGYLARHLGLEPTRFGAPTPPRTWSRNFTREFMAVFNTWLFQT